MSYCWRVDGMRQDGVVLLEMVWRSSLWCVMLELVDVDCDVVENQIYNYTILMGARVSCERAKQFGRWHDVFSPSAFGQISASYLPQSGHNKSNEVFLRAQTPEYIPFFGAPDPKDRITRNQAIVQSHTAISDPAISDWAAFASVIVSSVLLSCPTLLWENARHYPRPNMRKTTYYSN